MTIRDATEDDLDRLAHLADTSRDAAHGMLRDRTVRVHCKEAAPEAPVTGVVSFDATEVAVQVTRLAGEVSCYERLLEEPLRFANTENLPVEMVVPQEAQDLRRVLDEAGFESVREGPSFQGQATTLFRCSTDSG